MPTKPITSKNPLDDWRWEKYFGGSIHLHHTKSHFHGWGMTMEAAMEDMAESAALALGLWSRRNHGEETA